MERPRGDALAWSIERLAELRRENPARWVDPLVSGAHDEDASRRALLEINGFSLRGTFSAVNMLRRLDDGVLAPVVPDGFFVREVAPTEAPLRAAAHRAVWLPWSDGAVSDHDYARFMQMPGYRRDLDVVTVAPDGVFAAAVTGWLDHVNRIGDVGEVGTVPAYRRLGLMRAALLECLRRMRAGGMNRACVSTGVDNAPAIRLYESIGFTADNRYLDYARIE